jgi:hypothetical protein
MKLLLLSLITALPSLAQFVSIEITFEGIGCASCMESLPERMKRLRGVESAKVDAERGTLQVRLAAANRVKLEQVRDMIEQDGTKTKQASVQVKGELSRQVGKWVLKPGGGSASYWIEGTAPAAPGTYLVSGTVEKMRPDSGDLVIRARELHQAER